MRNREQIYGQEAAGLLRNITVYHCIRRDQLLRLYPGKESVIENLLRYLVKQQRIFYNTDRDCYGDVPDCREDRELTAALWVLLDFIEKVEYHSPDNMPAKLVFFADGEVYEVVYVGPGKEALLQHALAAEDDSGQRLVIIEEEDQMQHLHIPHIAAYCMVDDQGCVQYFRKEEPCGQSHPLAADREHLNEITRLSNTLYAMDNTNIQRHSDNYEMLSTEAALRGEVIACRLRHLIYETTTIRKAEYLTAAGVMQGISVIEKDGILEITLPCLLPKKSKKHSCEYLTDPIYYTLSKYAQTHTLLKFRHCVVCFSHIYSRELSPNRVRDYDNLELKQLLDVIATFVMEDDTGLLCDAYNTTDIGDSDCTRVSVMDKERFQGWLSDRENRLRSISDL